MDALSTAILNLYDGVYQIEFTHFREFCLQTAGKLISYDRAMWVTGIVATQTILSASVINIDLDLLMKYQAHYMQHDAMLELAIRSPGEPLRLPDPDRATPALGPGLPDDQRPAHAKRIMITAHHDAATDISDVLAYYGDDSDRPFTNHERDAQRLLFPHMIAAWRQRQMAKLYEDAGAPLPHQNYAGRGNAVVSDDGLIIAADGVFTEMILGRYPDWKGPHLPAMISSILSGAIDKQTIAGLDYRLTRGDGRHLVRWRR
jgi:hypothetical protein